MIQNQEMQNQQPAPPSVADPIKIVIVGDIQVGKTSLIQRFIANQLPSIYIPTGFDKYTASFEVGGHHFCTNIWDTSGSPTYDTVRPLVYTETDVFLLCFNLGDWYSLHNVIQKWYPEIRKYTSKPNTPIVLIGCQNDQRFMPPSTPTGPNGGNYSAPFAHLAQHPHSHQHYDLEQLDDCKRKIVFSEEAMEVSQQIGAITYVETCAYNPLSVREAFEVAALAANGKILLMNSPAANNGSNNARKTSSPFYGLKHFISLSTSSTTVSSPVSNISSSIGNWDGSSTNSGQLSSIHHHQPIKLKTSSSSTHLTRNRSLFKLRKCKSKSDMKHSLSCHSGSSIMLGTNGSTASGSAVDSGSGSSCSNSEISKKSCMIM